MTVRSHIIENERSYVKTDFQKFTSFFPKMFVTRQDRTGIYDMDIEPDDIEASDTVTVLWDIG